MERYLTPKLEDLFVKMFILYKLILESQHNLYQSSREIGIHIKLILKFIQKFKVSRKVKIALKERAGIRMVFV